MNRNGFIGRYNDLTGVFLRGFAKGKKVGNIAFVMVCSKYRKCHKG